MTDFVLEIFSEEIPARMQKNSAENFLKIAQEVFAKNNLNFDENLIKVFISPRRLALILKNLDEKQIQNAQKKIGPKLGSDPRAIEGFLKSTGKDKLEDLQIIDGFYVFNKSEIAIKTAEIITSSLPIIMQKMQNSWQKLMRYDVDQDGNQAKWVRPIRGIVALFGEQIIDFNFAFIQAKNISFDKYGNQILINHAKDYEHILQKNNIIIDQDERRQKILQKLHKITHENYLKLPDNFEKSAFFEELIGLCESPEVLIGEIDNKFLELPNEALILTLQSNQKYICCTDFDDKFSSKFLFIVDCEINENNVKKIIADNEKIMRARLADLEFFVDEDLKNNLSDYVVKLQKIIYHQKIGTIFEKVERLKEMAKFLSIFVPHCEIGLIERGVELAKADLATKAVAELPELQGLFGSFYATKQLENHKIAEAIYEHYLPNGATSPTAKSPLGITLAIADKIDIIVGFFLIDEKPTSSKDPFALRRCALGIIRTSHQHNIAFPIRILVERSLKSYPPKLLKKYISDSKKDFFELKKKLIEEIVRFIVERLKVYLKDQEQVRQDVLNVVINAYLESLESHKSVDILYLIKKIKFLDNFLSNDDHKKLIEIYKRSTNILAIEEKKDNKKYQGRPSVLGFKSKYEKLLYRRIKQISRDFYKFINKAEFEKAFALLAVIEAPLDHFFEHVIVNDVDNYARENRLVLLAMIRDLFHEVGDLSKICG
jgi:glycyl-tRNA synthetase beta chain